jgi:hypothetical protein
VTKTAAIEPLIVAENVAIGQAGRSLVGEEERLPICLCIIHCTADGRAPQSKSPWIEFQQN